MNKILQKNPGRIKMSEILEISKPNLGLNKIEDIPHYPRFEEIIDELTHKQILDFARLGYNTVVEFQGGVIDE